jgi:integral membrane protein (TIGR00529 family)
MWVLMALGIALLLVVLAPRLRWPQTVGYLAAALLLTLAGTAGPSHGALTLWHAAFASGTLAFVAAVCAVFVLSGQLQEAGALADLTRAASVRLNSARARAAVLPAIIGLLPMPGGAVVSAPMVEECGSGTREEQHFTNYWFRHIWEIWWPLYPPVLLAAELAHIPLLPFCLLLAPLMAFMVVIGVVWILRPLPALESQRREHGSMSSVALALGLMLITAPALALAGPELVPVSREWHVTLAVLPAVAFLTLRHGWLSLQRTLTSRRLWALVAMAASIKLFGSMVEGSGAASEASEMAARFHAAWSGVILLPLLAGLATGNTVAAVSLSFPLVGALALVRDSGADGRIFLFAVAYASGFVGYLLSPVHMCFVLSARYFGAELARGLSKLLLPVAAFGLLSAAWFLMWSALS